MINLFSRNCPDSYFVGSYLGDPEFPIKTGDSLQLINDIDSLTHDKRSDLLFDYVTKIAVALLDYGFYGDELIFVEHNKECNYGYWNT